MLEKVVLTERRKIMETLSAVIDTITDTIDTITLSIKQVKSCQLCLLTSLSTAAPTLSPVTIPWCFQPLIYIKSSVG